MKRPEVLAGKATAWMLKCNPSTFDIVALRDSGEPIDNWRVVRNYRSDYMQAGDRVFLWVTGSSDADPRPGVWAEGEVADLVYEAKDFETGKETVVLYVPVRMRWVDPLIERDALLDDPRFRTAEIIVQAQMSNPLVLNADETDAIEERLEPGER